MAGKVGAQDVSGDLSQEMAPLLAMTIFSGLLQVYMASGAKGQRFESSRAYQLI
jgi:hypothetical protein